MGCGTSKSDVVSLPAKVSKGSVANGNGVNSSEPIMSSPSDRSESSTIPANDFLENGMSNDSGSATPVKASVTHVLPSEGRRRNELSETEVNILPKQRRPDPVSFEVPAEEDETLQQESLIKRHPPRRLLKAAEDTPALTQELLNQKTELANERRSQALNKRIASARQKSARIVNRILDETLPEQL